VAAGNDLPKKQSPRLGGAAESPKPPGGASAGRQSPAQSQHKKALDEKHMSSGRV